MGIMKCLFCSFSTNSVSELLEHEDRKHGKMIATLDGVDGAEEEKDITGEEPTEEEEE